MRIRCRFEEKAFTVGLLNNPSARDLATMLPLDLVVQDFSTNEKIAYLPRKLTEEGGAPFSNEAAGDLCYYAPWGNLAFFHGGYKYSSGLIRIGRLDDGPQPLLTRGTFALRIELLPPA
ncbi:MULTISPECIES: cyclophilin-like fold protein [unclassified Bradyrhizobium]|uniref:cyclophilin-like fold protein n=1 Tax=unclassified Bradyrhizobium TaxID=2631580 RepID=UPI001FF7CCC1|nr:MULTISPECIES: cyclophilin-like fold protein [unclassified Bradyrhizobium]MCK1708149.1 MFS transporter [Bradyrhizobium sp. 143]MCK1725086.1 MFS transporter [Bradyrhizobium sp. 142]